MLTFLLFHGVNADVFAKTYGMQCIGLRYFNVFGKRQDPNGAYAAVIPMWVKKLINHERPVINGDGSYSRDFTYIENVVQANEKALFTPEEQILKGQREYCNLEIDEHKYLLQVQSSKDKVQSGTKEKQNTKNSNTPDRQNSITPLLHYSIIPLFHYSITPMVIFSLKCLMLPTAATQP